MSIDVTNEIACIAHSDLTALCQEWSHIEKLTHYAENLYFNFIGRFYVVVKEKPSRKLVGFIT